MYEIIPLKDIDFGATGNLAILQNAQFVLSTVMNTCFMDREFGWEPPIDDPSEQAKVLMSAQIVEVLEKTIPEISVEEVSFDEEFETGKIFPRVKVVINDGSQI
ncbi:hypothetical protein [Peribacillus phoenicis]|uniref:hypothetical protein n=1 Tax=unclassified Peribacillus TaxID=2675266 RepID=UPI0039A0AAFA